MKVQHVKVARDLVYGTPSLIATQVCISSLLFPIIFLCLFILSSIVSWLFPFVNIFHCFVSSSHLFFFIHKYWFVSFGRNVTRDNSNSRPLPPPFSFDHFPTTGQPYILNRRIIPKELNGASLS